MLWLSLTKRDNATFGVIEIIPPFDTITVAYFHKRFEKRRVQCKSSANEGEGMRNPLIKIA